MPNTSLTHDEFGNRNNALFARIASDLRENGYSINPDALPEGLGEKLYQHLGTMEQEQFDRAGIGRDRQLMQDSSVRRDEICWITGESEAGREWLDWTRDMQVFLNRQLFLGLFSFESHFAHYREGAFYKRHLDAFAGEGNRVLSVVVYLNHDWAPEHGGELVLFTDNDDFDGVKVTPGFGTVLVFLSEEFPHEVRATNRDRYSVAGWFRLNTSTSDKVDPPS